MDHFVLLNRPTIRQLEYVAAVAVHRHFSHAAQACSVTQPALSAQVLALEESLGVTLFERSRRGVIPTPEGERLLPLIDAVLRATDHLVDTAKESRDPLAGEVRIGVIPTVAPYLLPYVMPALRKEFPKLRALPYEERTDTLLSMLREGALDAAWLALPVEGDDLSSVRLYVEEFVVAMRRDHPLAKKTALRIQDLATSSVLLLEDGH